MLVDYCCTVIFWTQGLNRPNMYAKVGYDGNSSYPVTRNLDIQADTDSKQNVGTLKWF